MQTVRRSLQQSNVVSTTNERKHGMNTPIRQLATSILICLPVLAHAQNYPSKPIRSTIGTPAGGPGDVALRGAAQAISESLGQPMVVENRVGVGGVASADACSKAAPDGHQLCSCDQQTMAINMYTRASLPYHPAEIAPVVLYGFLAAGIHVHPSVPANTLQELFAMARAKPGAVTFGSFGQTSAAHLYVEWFKKARGIEFLNVPYKAASLAWPAMLAGEVQATYFALTSAAVSMVKAGKAKTLMVALDQRFTEMPSVPTWKEAGLEFPLVTWFGLCAPAKTPRDIVTRLNQTVVKGLLNNATLKAKFITSQGIQTDSPAGGSPESFAQLIAEEQKRYQQLVKLTGVRED
jgi:tripartite-type tricarboxylate transporter receptor subunit TctC